MTSSHQPILYDKLIRLTHVYLGPAADRFISRQIQNHLNKEPRDLTREDLLLLIDWIRVTVSLLTDDNEVVEEYIAQVRNLAMAQDEAN